MKTTLHWFSHILPIGCLGICPRPRGNDWLEDELHHFKNSGVDILISTLEWTEEYELELLEESKMCDRIGLIYLSYPIEDRHVPTSMKTFYGVTKEVADELSAGQNVMIHCRQGIGRSSLFAAGVLRHLWAEPAKDIFSFIEKHRGREVPDTNEQILWLQNWIHLFF